MKPQTKNTLWSVAQHFVAILCALILPREILSHYGSEMNGLVHSIAQFLSYTALLELGVGAVIPSALYQPLLENDSRQVSAILASGRRVFRRIALICALYTLLLAALFPALTGIRAALLLVLVMGAAKVASYTAGLPEQLLIKSDQKGYIIYSLSTASNLLNTALQVALIRSGRPLVLVMAVGTGVSLVQILLICLYVRRHYDIDLRIRYDAEPIPQKWSGIAQHVAYFVLENTDIILLTLFSTFREISVYSVYAMVIAGVRRIFTSIVYSIHPKLGELLARGEQEKLERFFTAFERCIHIGAVLIFGCVGALLVPFVRAYTEGVTDANYTRPVFALLMTLAYGCQSIREPYDGLILASGHFRQTQHNYIIAACLNLGLSLLTVRFWGLEGVAFGTLAAMAYQMVYMSVYDTRVFLKRSLWALGRVYLLDAALIAAGVVLFRGVDFPAEALFARLLSILRP